MAANAEDAMLSVVSAFVGCGIATFFAKYVLMKALHDLEILHNKVNDVALQLAAISVRLERISEYDILLREHATKIASLETTVDDANSRLQRYVQ